MDGNVTEEQQIEAIKDFYIAEFETFPDGRCTIQTVLGGENSGTVESMFRGTKSGSKKTLTAPGVDVIQFHKGKFREMRVYHRMA